MNSPIDATQNQNQVMIATTTEAAKIALETPGPVKMENLVAMDAYVKKYYAEDPILVKVARCESEFRQFDSKGNILRGLQNSDDVGVMQINEKYHLERAKKLGYDIYTLDGNLAYAKFLYHKEGVDPWSASAPCWKNVKIDLAQK